MSLTKYDSNTTIIKEEVLNSWFGGLYDTEVGNKLDPEDPLVAGHVHDGLHLDGHAQKIHLQNHVLGQLNGENIVDHSIPLSKLSFTPGSGGGGENLAETLVIGNVTGGNDIVISSGDAIKAPDGLNGDSIFLNPGAPVGAAKYGSIYNFSANQRGSRAIDFQNYNSNPDNRAEADYTSIFGGSNNRIFEPTPAYSGTHRGATIVGGNESLIGGVESKGSVIFGSGYSRLGFNQYGYSNVTGKTYGIKNSVISGVACRIYGYADNCVNFGLSNKINTVTDNPEPQSSNFISGSYNQIRTNVIYTGSYLNQGSSVNTVLGGGHRLYISKNSFVSGLDHWNMGNYNLMVGIGSRVKTDYSFIAGSFSRSVVATTKEECAYSASFGAKSYLYNRGQATLSGITGSPPYDYGSASQSSYSLIGITNNATPTVLTTDGNSEVESYQRLRILPGTVYNFRILLSAYQSGGIAGTISDSSTWFISGAIKRDLSNNTTLMSVTGTGAAEFNDVGAAAWTVSVTADDLNESLVVTVTGEADKDIVWHADIHSSEAGGYYEF